MAGWLLLRSGNKKIGLQCLEQLLKENSYATLSVLNIMDWAGDYALLPTVRALKLKITKKRCTPFACQTQTQRHF